MENNQSNLIGNYRYKLRKIAMNDNGCRLERCFIVLVHQPTGVIEAITDYADYCMYKTLGDSNYTKTAETSMYSVIMFLNFLFIDKHTEYKIFEIEDLTIKMVKDFLNWYIFSSTKQNVRPSKESVIAKRNHISDFIYNLCASTKHKMKHINKDDICEESLLRVNNGEKLIRKYLVKVVYDDTDSGYRSLYRDMPLQIVDRCITLAKIYDPELVFPIALMSYVGLREGEVVNIRRKTSCYGPNIIFTRPIPDSCEAIEIDLSSELALRSDGKSVGKIKKERHQSVCPAFVNKIDEYYKYHLSKTSDKATEVYAPMFLSSKQINGKYMALTKSALTVRIKRLFYEHVLPSMENDENLDFRLFYEAMKDHTWGPHSFRHWFTVVLVLMGYDEVQVMSFRGDKSIESSRRYLERKGELQRLYSESNEILGEIITG